MYESDEDGFAYLMMEDAGRPEPGSYQEALEDPDSELWMGAADEEMESLIKNGTWVLVDRVKDQKPIGCRWIFKRKAGIAGVEDPRYKGRLVAKGYAQKEGVDFQEIFFPVCKTCLYQIHVVHGGSLRHGASTDRCQDSVPAWISG